jgi:hypothetical protein
MPEILPTWHTETYCATLEALPREEAVRAIHSALIQLEAIEARVMREALGFLNNGPAIHALRACLKKAGHLGFEEV